MTSLEWFSISEAVVFLVCAGGYVRWLNRTPNIATAAIEPTDPPIAQLILNRVRNAQTLLKTLHVSHDPSYRALRDALDELGKADLMLQALGDLH